MFLAGLSAIEASLFEGAVSFCEGVGCNDAITHIRIASSTFSVESVAGDLKLAGHEVEHGQEVLGGAVAAGFTFSRGEKTVQPLHKGGG